MRGRSQSWYRSKNAKARRESLIQRSRKGVAARERKRLENPVEREPKLVPYFPLELGVRDKLTGETAWVDFRSVRDATRRLSVVRRFYRNDECGMTKDEGMQNSSSVLSVVKIP